MTRLSDNQVIGGRLINGYDYTNQAWVKDGVYAQCGHAVKQKSCFSCYHAGRQTGAGGEAYFLGMPSENQELLEAKKRLYRNLLAIEPEQLTESDLRLMQDLVKDPTIQALFEKKK